jgi:ribonuclease P protein component
LAKQFTLGKNERLKSRKQIEQLFSEGRKFTVTPFRVFYLFQAPLSSEHLLRKLQFGVGVSVKNFKRAVDRNRIKRLTREAYRLQKNELAEKLKVSGSKLNVFFIYTAKEIPDFKLVKDKVALVLKKFEKIVDENIPTDT